MYDLILCQCFNKLSDFKLLWLVPFVKAEMKIIHRLLGEEVLDVIKAICEKNTHLGVGGSALNVRRMNRANLKALPLSRLARRKQAKLLHAQPLRTRISTSKIRSTQHQSLRLPRQTPATTVRHPSANIFSLTARPTAVHQTLQTYNLPADSLTCPTAVR